MTDAAIDNATPGYVSGALLARVLDLDPRRIQQLTKDGVLLKNDAGKYHLLAPANAYFKFIHSKIGRADAGPDGFVAQRTRFLGARADIAELERERVAEGFVDAEVAAEQWRVLSAFIRKKLFAIVPAVTPRVMKYAKASEIYTVLQDAIHDALSAIANTRVTMTKPRKPRSRD